MSEAQHLTPLIEAFERAGIPFELLEHNRTMTAADEAAALGLPPHEVAKTVVVTAASGNVRVVVPASDRIDMHKLRELFGAGKEVHLLTEGDLARVYPEFELGAVPPVGGPTDEVVVDRRLVDRDAIVFEAGAHDRSVRVSPRELIALTGARVADLCRD